MATNQGNLNENLLVKLLENGVNLADAMAISGGNLDALVEAAGLSEKRLGGLNLFLTSTSGLTDEEKQIVENQLVISKIALVNRTGKNNREVEYFHCLVRPRVGNSIMEASLTVFQNNHLFDDLMTYWAGLSEDDTKRLKELREKKSKVLTTPIEELKTSLSRQEKLYDSFEKKGEAAKTADAKERISTLIEQIENYDILSKPLSENELDELHDLESQQREPTYLTQKDFEGDKWQLIKYNFADAREIIGGKILYKLPFQTDEGTKYATLVQLTGETKQDAIDRFEEFRRGDNWKFQQK